MLDQARVQVSLNVEVWCNNGHCRESGGCGGEGARLSYGKYPGQLSRADVWRGRLSKISFKVLLFGDLVGVVSSGYVTRMAVTRFDPS